MQPVSPAYFGTDAVVDWSPDGTRFSISADDAHDDQLFVADPGRRRSWTVKPPAPVEDLQDVAWISRSAVVAIFTRAGSARSDLIEFDVRSGQRLRLISSRTLRVGTPGAIAWSAAAKRLAMEIEPVSGAGPIAVADVLHHPRPAVRVPLRSFSGFDVSWSPERGHLISHFDSRVVAWPSRKAVRLPAGTQMQVAARRLAGRAGDRQGRRQPGHLRAPGSSGTGRAGDPHHPRSVAHGAPVLPQELRSRAAADAVAAPGGLRDAPSSDRR
jgi:hypothetical protein